MYAQDNILCQFGLINLSSVQQLISQPILIHFWWELYQTDPTQADHLLDEAVATAMQALRCTPNTSLGNYSPGALVFQRDMFLNLPLITDIITLTRHRQAQIDSRLVKINSCRIVHDYAVGDKVYYRNFDQDKLDAVRFGPYQVLRVHTNNTVTLQRSSTHECVSICHLTPFRPS